MTREILTQDRLKEIINYNPETGIITWIRPRQKINTSDVSGSLRKDGYIGIMIDYKPYMAHRLVWLYLFGKFPNCEIDHINHIRNDNRLSNLREATRRENGINLSIKSNNKSGVNGVHWSKSQKRWIAYIRINYIRKHLGSFTDFFEACCARKSANIKYGYHKNHGK